MTTPRPTVANTAAASGFKRPPDASVRPAQPQTATTHELIVLQALLDKIGPNALLGIVVDLCGSIAGGTYRGPLPSDDRYAECVAFAEAAR